METVTDGRNHRGKWVRQREQGNLRHSVAMNQLGGGGNQRKEDYEKKGALEEERGGVNTEKLGYISDKRGRDLWMQKSGGAIE